MKKRRSLFKTSVQWLISVTSLYVFFPSLSFAAVDISTNGGLMIRDADDPCYWFSLGGRLNVDGTIFSGKTYDKQGEFPSGAIIRRLYLDFNGGVGNYWEYDLTLSFLGNHWRFQPQPGIVASQDNRFNSVVIREALVSYKGFEDTTLSLGQVAYPAGLENWGDYNDLFFLEPSLLTGTFFPEDPYGIGIYADHRFCDLFTLAGAIFHPRQSIKDNFGAPRRSDVLGGSVRLTVSPIHEECCVTHFGVWGLHQTLKNHDVDGTLLPFPGIAGVPEAQARNTGALVNTGPLASSGYGLTGAELAFLHGPLLLQGEYLFAGVRRAVIPPRRGRTLQFSSWYAQAGYVLTGECRGYDFDTGTFTRVMRPYDCCIGAWEFVARYSMVNLNSRDVLGGTERNYSFGLNWYMNEIIRVSGNYVRAIANPTDTQNPGTRIAPRRSLDIFGVRLQVAF